MPSAVRDPASLTPDHAMVARFRRALDRRLRTLPGLSPEQGIGIAVSGGPDSVALLLLARAALPGLVEAATVDHGLRPDSAAEALDVAALCAQLGVPHATLKSRWDRRVGPGLQASAREYRYRELGRWCGRRGLPILVTAHHADDQAETLLMRLARGAGIAGLGAIRPALRLPASRPGGSSDEADRPNLREIALLRPLLRFAKADLQGIVSAAGLIAATDPANDSDRFDRTHARRLLASADWLDPARLAGSASHLAEAEEALRWAAMREAAVRVATDKEDRLLDPSGLPDEILRRLVVDILSTIEHQASGDEARHGPSGPKVMRLIERLRVGESATLGHVLARSGTRWRFSVAPPRRAPRNSRSGDHPLDCH